MQMDVFRPTDGPLTVPNPITFGHPENPDTFRKDANLIRRPHTQSGYRFGQLSFNSFFTRHSPHPNRVRHMKGLLDVPICTVNDSGYLASPKYEMLFPPNSYDTLKMNHWRTSIPVNSIHLGANRLPLDTINGLQYFTGLQNYSNKDFTKAIDSEKWREELQLLINGVRQKPIEHQSATEKERPKTQYSERTGRLVPPPSRSMSRQRSQLVSRRGTGQEQIIPILENAESSDLENTVFLMLCQILQTQDPNAVQTWLCNAPVSEKNKMMELIESALKGREQYYQQRPLEQTTDARPLTAAVAEEISKNRDTYEINRLVLDETVRSHDKTEEVEPRPWARPTAPAQMNTTEDVEQPAHVSEKVEPAARIQTTYSPKPESSSRLRYTKAPTPLAKEEIKNVGLTEWVPQKSLCT